LLGSVIGEGDGIDELLSNCVCGWYYAIVEEFCNGNEFKEGVYCEIVFIARHRSRLLIVGQQRIKASLAPFAQLEVALPSLPTELLVEGRTPMEHVVIGMDPHKRSVMTGAEQVLAKHRFETTAVGFRQLLSYAKQWPDRLWTVGGCNGIGRHVASRLVVAGETVVEVPPKLSARLRMFDTRQGRKTDPDDAHAIAMVAVRMNGLRAVVNDERHALLRILADRRRGLGEDHTRMISQVHQLLLELIPGGAKKDLSAAQARVLLAGVRPRDVVGKTRKRVALELVGDLEKIYQRSKALDKEIKQLVVDTGSSLMDLHGIGPSSAARLMIEVGDITRFPDRNHFASWNGTAPLDASSGDQTRHRLSRAGNRQINRALHVMAIVQLRDQTEGRAYYDRRKAAGKTLWKPCAAQTPTLRHRLSHHDRRRDHGRGGPGRATGQRL
jgi:transposase